MANSEKKIFAVNTATGESKVFASHNDAARTLGATYQQVQIAVLRGGAVRGWRVYDTPENIRKRIAELEEQLKMFEE